MPTRGETAPLRLAVQGSTTLICILITARHALLNSNVGWQHRARRMTSVTNDVSRCCENFASVFLFRDDLCMAIQIQIWTSKTGAKTILRFSFFYSRPFEYFARTRTKYREVLEVQGCVWGQGGGDISTFMTFLLSNSSYLQFQSLLLILVCPCDSQTLLHEKQSSNKSTSLPRVVRVGCFFLRAFTSPTYI